MADMYGSHFEYGGVSSRQYNLIIANVDTSRVTMLGGKKEGVTVFNKKSKRKYLIGDNYVDSPLSFEIEILTEDGTPFAPTERRQIEKWLFNYRAYRKLYLDDADDEFGESCEYVDGKPLRNYLNCRLINPEKIEYQGGVVGYKATLEADSNMYWQDAVVKTFDIDNTTSSNTNITITVDTDIDEYIYPRVVIRMGANGGAISIANLSDDTNRTTQFTGIGANASITMKGEINYVSGEYYEKFIDRNFIRLLDGENKLNIAGDITSITFEYSARRRL